MGLDMYLTGRKIIRDQSRKEDGKQVTEVAVELGYWRKHPNLHGYIVETFAGGEDDCQPISLNKERIEDIITAVENEQLPETTGFLFGVSDGSEKQGDLKIFREALEWLAADDKEAFRLVEYKASW